MEKAVVIIADANPRILRFLSREFSEVGLRVKAATNYDEIFYLLDRAPAPDLVVIDPDIPYLKEQSAFMNALGHLPRIPVVIYTPYTEYAEHPVFGKADAFVEKTANPALLIETVLSLIRRKENSAGLSIPPDR